MGVKPQVSKLTDPGLGPASLHLESPGQLAPSRVPGVVRGEQVPKHCEVAAGEQLIDLKLEDDGRFSSSLQEGKESTFLVLVFRGDRGERRSSSFGQRRYFFFLLYIIYLY